MKSLKEFGNVTIVYDYHKFNAHKILKDLIHVTLTWNDDKYFTAHKVFHSPKETFCFSQLSITFLFQLLSPMTTAEEVTPFDEPLGCGDNSVNAIFTAKMNL